jgi:hypothetical protein
MSSTRTDMNPTELIDAFKNKHMDFDPHTAFKYNNSGYILLGHIIEVMLRSCRPIKERSKNIHFRCQVAKVRSTF